MELKNHILASTLLGIIQSSDSSPSKSDKLKAIVTKFGTNEINMDTNLPNSKTLRKSMDINYGSMPYEETVIEFLSKYLKPDSIGENISRAMIPYSLEDFAQAVEFATLYEGSVSSQRIQEYTATLMTRLQSLQEGIQGRILSKTVYGTVDDYINMLLGENQIVDLDISSLDDASAEVVTKVLAKLLLDYLKKKDSKAETPIIVNDKNNFT